MGSPTGSRAGGEPPQTGARPQLHLAALEPAHRVVPVLEEAHELRVRCPAEREPLVQLEGQGRVLFDDRPTAPRDGSERSQRAGGRGGALPTAHEAPHDEAPLAESDHVGRTGSRRADPDREIEGPQHANHPGHARIVQQRGLTCDDPTQGRHADRLEAPSIPVVEQLDPPVESLRQARVLVERHRSVADLPEGAAHQRSGQRVLGEDPRGRSIQAEADARLGTAEHLTDGGASDDARLVTGVEPEHVVLVDGAEAGRQRPFSSQDPSRHRSPPVDLEVAAVPTVAALEVAITALPDRVQPVVPRRRRGRRRPVVLSAAPCHVVPIPASLRRLEGRRQAPRVVDSSTRPATPPAYRLNPPDRRSRCDGGRTHRWGRPCLAARSAPFGGSWFLVGEGLPGRHLQGGRRVEESRVALVVGAHRGQRRTVDRC